MGSKFRRHFLRHREAYEEAIEKYVCSKCIDSDQRGVCHSKDLQGCAIIRNLPSLIEIASNLHSLKMGPYLKAVRAHVCSDCENSKAGVCLLREATDCGLDRYLPLIIEAIEETHQKIMRAITDL